MLCLPPKGASFSWERRGLYLFKGGKICETPFYCSMRWTIMIFIRKTKQPLRIVGSPTLCWRMGNATNPAAALTCTYSIVCSAGDVCNCPWSENGTLSVPFHAEVGSCVLDWRFQKIKIRKYRHITNPASALFMFKSIKSGTTASATLHDGISNSSCFPQNAC